MRSTPRMCVGHLLLKCFTLLLGVAPALACLLSGVWGFGAGALSQCFVIMVNGNELGG